VGDNTSQKGDGEIGGEKFVCPTGTIPKEKAFTKVKHWTLLGVTACDGSPVMWVVIFAGKQKISLYETGMDPFANIKNTPTEKDFFDNNSGPGKLYPGGPKCTYKGKEVLCMCRWTSKVSIDSTILTNILRTLDVIGCYDGDRRNGFKPILLLDTHVFRMELEFLSYINSAGTEWVVCIGVLYSTALWQVGDSSQQNGSYQMTCTQFKRRLLIMKRSRRLIPCIHP